MKTRPFSTIHRRGGFTLIEMLLTIAIFLLLSASVFAIVSGVLKSASTLQDNQERRDQISALQFFLQARFRQLPAQVRMISYLRGDGEGLAQNGIVWGNFGTATALDALRQPNGYYTLQLGIGKNIAAARTDPATAGKAFVIPGDVVDKHYGVYDWRLLLKDVKTMSWKFQDGLSPNWQDDWNNLSANPTLIEFTFQMAGESKPITMDFWIPRLTSADVNLPQPSQ